MLTLIYIVLVLVPVACVGCFLYAWSYAKNQGYTLKQLWNIYNDIEDKKE